MAGGRFRLPRRFFPQEKFGWPQRGRGRSAGRVTKSDKGRVRTLPHKRSPGDGDTGALRLAKTREHGAAFKIAPAKEAPATELPGLPLWGRLEWQETVLRAPNAPAARGVPARHKGSARVFRLKRPARNDKRTLVRFSPPLVRFSPRPLLLYAAGVQA